MALNARNNNGSNLAQFKSGYLTDMSAENNQGTMAGEMPDYYRFDLSLDGFEYKTPLNFDISLADDLVTLGGGFDLNLFAGGSVGFAFDANPTDLKSAFLIDTEAGVSAMSEMPDDMQLLREKLSGGEGNAEIVAGAYLESTQPLEGSIAFLELAASSSDENTLGLGAPDRDGSDLTIIAPEDDPF